MIINDKLESENAELLTKIAQLKNSSYKNSNFFNNEDFWLFFMKFMEDSTFQISRIKFPLTYITWKKLPNGNLDIGGEIDTVKIDRNNWLYDSFYINQATERTQVYDNFNLQFHPTNERALHWFGVETGGDIKYFFKGFNGKWFLVKKEDLGD